eukprot:gnl/Spiro4/24528_TR12162_c0_g1_i1.p1 gnl/Spiro4/24528_TR12162_c0_g1~~gnl/Spiro4/24528_TR12162_c0_g1_i1.p1  ORF type:complete len:855 (-),score=185.48 gnl/Spiro4/24528_TR12162_c0_g1_i1:75-2639(-)
MSLFKAREWWSTRAVAGETFGAGCLTVGNIDNEASGRVKIVTGNFQGMLRVYSPHQQDYRPEDLMLEVNLHVPILQVEIARFVLNPSQPAMVSLAVLHPRELAVFVMSYMKGETLTDSYYSLDKVYSHVLERTAFNFVYGSFGGNHANDYICVQSMDGVLSFFEQDRVSLTRSIPNFLVPGPLCYLATTDSFITFNSSLEVVCFRYIALQSSYEDQVNPAIDAFQQQQQQPSAPNSLFSVKKVAVDWALNIGEQALSIFIGRFTGPAPDIIVLGEHTLFCLSEIGQLRYQRRLGYDPSCAHAFPSDDGPTRSHNLLIASFTQNLMVYKHKHLRWNATVPCVPVAMCVLPALCNIQGMICMVADNGRITVLYLGTVPPTNRVVPVDSDVSYNDLKEETARVMSDIRVAEAGASGLELPTDMLKLTVMSMNSVARLSALDPFGSQSTVLDCAIELQLSYSGTDALHNIDITLDVPSGFTVRENHLTLFVLETHCMNIPILVSLDSTCHMVPSSLKLGVTALCPSPIRSAYLEVDLPLYMAGRLGVRAENQAFKMIIDTNRAPFTLPQLFPELYTGGDVALPSTQHINNVATLRLHAVPVDSSILVSKNAGRYCVQGNNFDALWILATALVASLRRLSDADLEVRYNDMLPLKDYLGVVESHFEKRRRRAHVDAELGKRAHQCRVVQKSLLVRFKDKTPVNMQNVDKLYSATHNDILKLADELVEAQQDLVISANSLSCATRLLLLLISLKFNLDELNSEALSGYLSPSVSEQAEYGWEETTEAGLQYCLRCVMTRNPKPLNEAGLSLTPLTDIKKLETSIIRFIDRLSKGGRLVAPLTTNEAQLAADHQQQLSQRQ